jgi:hypothetical protein
MAKKLPKGVSIKTKPIEVGLVDMFVFQVWIDGVLEKEGYQKHHDTGPARAEGVKYYWTSVHAPDDSDK